MRRSVIVAVAGFSMLAACEETMIAETADLGSGLPSPSQTACMSAVANQTGDGNVTVLSGVRSRTKTEYVVGVGESRAPWRCVASEEGVVEDVSSMVNEGAL